MVDSPHASHTIAVEAAMQIVKRGDAAGLDWTTIAVSCETVVAIVVATCAQMAGDAENARFAQEMVDTITERAHRRVQALIRGVPYDG